MGEEDFTGMAGAIFSTDNMEVQPLSLEDLRLSTELKVELVGLQLQELVLEAVLLPGTGEAVAGATAVATQAIQAKETAAGQGGPTTSMARPTRPPSTPHGISRPLGLSPPISPLVLAQATDLWWSQRAHRGRFTRGLGYALCASQGHTQTPSGAQPASRVLQALSPQQRGSPCARAARRLAGRWRARHPATTTRTRSSRF